MPEELNSAEAPFIRVSRSGGASRNGNVRSVTFDPNEDVDIEGSPFNEEPAPTRRSRTSRAMPKRLSEERAEATTRRATEPARATAAKAAKAKAEQTVLDLKQPRKKQDSTVKKRQVLGTVLFVFAVLVAIAILSYTPNDAAVAETKFSEIFSVITRSDPTVNAHADIAQNRLGLIGAMLADFLINKTIGYASIIYPIFFGAWALAFFRFTTRQRQRLTLATTFFLITAILFSATVGTEQLISAFPHLAREWSGSVGQFLGLTFTRLIGAVGAFTIYATAFVITLVFSIDLDIEKTFLRIVGIYQTVLTTVRRRIVEFWDKREARKAEKAAQRENEAIEEARLDSEDSSDEVAIAASSALEQEAEPEVEAEEKVVARSRAPKAEKVIAEKAKTENARTEPGNTGAEEVEATPEKDTEIPVRIMRTDAAVIATAQFGGAILPDQPLLRVRPMSKSGANGEIPRITRTPADRLGTSGNIHRLSNGAFDTPGEQVEKTEAPIASEEENITPAPAFERIASERIANERAGVEREAKPEKRGTINDAIVQVGDESTLSNEALPHSVVGAGELTDAVREHQSLSRQVAKEIEKAKKAEDEASLFAASKGTIIPENPYNEVLSKYHFPSLDLLTPSDPDDVQDLDDEELAIKGRVLRDKLATFGVDIENITVTPGPVVTLFEFTPAEGVKVSRVENLTDDIALAMKARGIRIIAPIPGRGTIGVEIPNDVAKMVRIRPMFESESFRKTKMNLPLALGKTISGDVYVDDLNKMPHLLIAGATGSGKSVGVNAIIASLLYSKSPRDVKFVIVDPKKIELSLYKKLRKHYLIVSPEAGEEIVTTPAFAVVALKAVELEMERRYDKLAKAAVRSLNDYNLKVAQGKLHSTQDEQHYHLPYIVVIIDELADLMITAAREIEEPICRIAQMARAVGIHLILATQRPSVDVITGVIKANFPARIAYQVATRVDSRTILDTMGAEQLLGNGDMLYQPSGTPKPIRLQSPFISTEEVEAIAEAVAEQDGDKASYSRPWYLPSLKQKGSSSFSMEDEGRDELFEEAARTIIRHQQASTSLLQRRLKIGYSRAARIIDELEQCGIVSAFDGAKTRQVLCESSEELELVLEGLR